MKALYFVLTLYIFCVETEAMRKKCKKGRKCRPVTRSFNVSSLEDDHVARCPGEYHFEEGDTVDLLSPGYPNKRYPNRHDCTWSLHASGCQFRVECSEFFTRPSCVGPTWQPLTKCEGDFVRFYSDNFADQETGAEVKFSHKFCWRQTVNFTYGYSDNLYLQFKTDSNYRAKGFNCTVTCEGFDFGELFSRIPFTDDENEEMKDEDYYDYDEEEDDEDYNEYEYIEDE